MMAKIWADFQIGISVPLTKMKVLTCKTYKERCELYAKTHGSIAVNYCHVGYL